MKPAPRGRASPTARHAGLPAVLYRYRPWSVVKPDGSERKSITEIEGRFAYFSSPLRFNDPQDGLLGPEFAGGRGDIDRLLGHGFADVIRLARKNQCSVTQLDTSDPEVEAAQLGYKRLRARMKTCVLCLSWDWRSPLMWTFYAQEHQGLCLGYSTDGQLLAQARPVLYTHSPTDVLHLKDAKTRNDPLSFCKSADWQFEREWRICLREPGPKRVDLARERLVSVHTGYRMKDPQLQDLVAALRKAGYKPEETKLYAMERLPMSFVLCARPIRW
jgi:hypothetical protein